MLDVYLTIKLINQIDNQNMSQDNVLTEKDYEVLKEINQDYLKNKCIIEEYINSNKPESHVALSK